MGCGGCRERSEAIKRIRDKGDIKKEMKIIAESFNNDFRALYEDGIRRVMGDRPTLVRRKKSEKPK